MALLPPQVKMFLPMGLMFVYNKFGTEWQAPHLRLAYAATQILSLLAYVYIYFAAAKHASRTETLTVKTKQPVGPEKVEKLNFRQYDVREARNNTQQLLMGAALVIGIHSWKGYLQPLLIQAVMGLFMLVENPLFRIYVLGQPAVGDLQRPFKKDVSPLAALLGQGTRNPEESTPSRSTVEREEEPVAEPASVAEAVPPTTAGNKGSEPGQVRKRTIRADEQ